VQGQQHRTHQDRGWDRRATAPGWCVAVGEVLVGDQPLAVAGELGVERLAVDEVADGEPGIQEAGLGIDASEHRYLPPK
jgi:hypothetical protein